MSVTHNPDGTYSFGVHTFRTREDAEWASSRDHNANMEAAAQRAAANTAPDNEGGNAGGTMIGGCFRTFVDNPKKACCGVVAVVALVVIGGALANKG